MLDEEFKEVMREHLVVACLCGNFFEVSSNT